MPIIYERITKEQPDIGEWETDKSGKRFRRVGNCIEYEMMVRIDGLEIPQSQLAEYNARKKEQEVKCKEMALEEAKNRPEPKECPFSSGMNNNCMRENCALFLDGKCSIAILADASGVEIENKPKGKCPFSVYGRCGSCAMFNHGCAVARLAAATYKE